MTMLLDLLGSAEAPRHKWTRAEYEQMVEIGLLTREDHCELIEGEIVDKVPQKRPHGFTCLRVQHLLSNAYGSEFIQTQLPVALDDRNEPEPDVAVLSQPYATFVNEHPGPEVILLVVEVSNTMQRFDTSTKATLYARAQIPEYWVINLADRTLLVLRGPTPDGYTVQTTLTESETVSPLSAPSATLSIANMLPPVAVTGE